MRSIGFIVISLLLLSCSLEDGEITSNDSSVIYPGERYYKYDENPFLQVTEYPTSTFSVDTDGASYSNVKRMIEAGIEIPLAAIRSEDFLNYFRYDYQEPEGDEEVSVETEVTTCPWNDTHHLLRVGLKGRAYDESELAPSNYVFLIDVSHSMRSSDKLDLLKKGFMMLVDNLDPKDRVAIVTYAAKAGVALASTPCSEKEKIKNEIAKLGTKSSTAGSAGIERAYRIAQDNYILHGNNRVILGTDGDFNLGIRNTEELVKLIKEKKRSGVALTIIGVGKGNLNDNMMEQVANNGGGTYEYIYNENQLKKVFVDEKLKFYAAARDCKIQVTFSSDRVDAYRLIGYENRGLSKSHFDDDTVDAGEIGINQTVTALYELKLKDKEYGEFGQVEVRYKKDIQALSRLVAEKITGEALDIEDASESSRFAAAAIGAALWLKKSQYRGTVSKSMIAELAKNASIYDPSGARKEFYKLINNYYPPE